MTYVLIVEVTSDVLVGASIMWTCLKEIG